MPYNLHQNRVSERVNQTLKVKLQSMIIDFNLSKQPRLLERTP